MKPFPTFVVFFFVTIKMCSDNQKGGSLLLCECVLNSAMYQVLSHYPTKNVNIKKLNIDNYFNQVDSESESTLLSALAPTEENRILSCAQH